MRGWLVCGTPKYIGNAAFVFHSLMIRQGPSGSYTNGILILCLFQFGCFGISSSSLVTALAFSFLRSMRRAAFFCFFSRRAVSFCLFLKVSLAIKPPFQLGVPGHGVMSGALPFFLPIASCFFRMLRAW